MYDKSVIRLMFASSLVVLTAAVAVAQQHEKHATTLSLAVDGSKTPDEIPDEMAYGHFIKTIAISNTPTANDVKRREAFLLPLHLSFEDRDGLVTAMRDVKEQLGVIEVNRRFLTRTLNALETQADLKRRESELLAATQAKIISSLSPDGRKSLEKYIREYVKAHIKIYRSPM